ncbi:DNA-binding domain-containing protein, AraC-type [Caulobacter sp. AP07]|nr:DNA-binding domain-containing protein, AraC-type [Caulobacter sp. AP07]
MEQGVVSRSTQPSQFGVERFSTHGIHADKRLEFWNALNNETFTGLTVQAASDVTYSAQLDRLGIGAVRLAKAHSSASTIYHTREHVAQQGRDQHFLVHLQMTGKSVNRQAGREALLAPGDLAICDTTRPYSLEFDDSASFLVLRLPAGVMKRRLPRLEDAVAVRLTPELGRTGLLRSFVEAIWSESDQVSDPEHGSDLEPIVVDMAIACLSPACRPGFGLTVSRLEREVFALADRNFAAADYGVRHIAAASGLCPRSVQKLFAAKGTTASAYILARRLSWAAQTLETTDGKIVDIAADAGFNDQGYFARAFRAAFGASPRDYRRRRLK